VREVPGSNPGFPLLRQIFTIIKYACDCNERSSQTGVAVVDKRDEHIGADLVRGWEGIGGRSGDAFPGL
jgi:hypothetical protein